jgi:hypothetical protein
MFRIEHHHIRMLSERGEGAGEGVESREGLLQLIICFNAYTTRCKECYVVNVLW